MIKHVCQRNGCQAVIDIGSGLVCLSSKIPPLSLSPPHAASPKIKGYLGRCLALECGVTVVGVEAKQQLSESADRRMKSRRKVCKREECTGVVKSSSCKDGIPHPSTSDARNEPSNISVPLCLDGTPESNERMATLLSQIESEGASRMGVGVVGLHSCGDLTPHAEQLFISRPSLCHLVLVGCCYHKMSEGEGGYNYFPLSTLVKDLLKAKDQCIFNALALRLAAQETRGRWKGLSDGGHSHHEKQMAFRAIAEAVLSDMGSTLDKKLIRQADYADIGSFAESLSILMKDPSIKDTVLSYHDLYSQFIAYVEPFTALQTCMQGVLEGLVVLDRCVYLWEQGIQTEIVPVFDEDISPRCTALLASRS